MRQVLLNHAHPCPPKLLPRLARLTRHLQARLQDFGPGGPQVLSAAQNQGRIEVRFPGHDTAQVLQQLKHQGVMGLLEGEIAIFLLAPDTPFEDLDYLWGCLFSVLSE